MYPILYVNECKTPIQPFFTQDKAFLILTQENHYTLMEDRCAHLNIPLSEGWVEDGHIVCPWHQWKYNREGQCVFPKAAQTKCIHSEPLYLKEDILWSGTGSASLFWVTRHITRSYVDISLPKDTHLIWRLAGLKDTTRIWCGASARETAVAALEQFCLDIE